MISLLTIDNENDQTLLTVAIENDQAPTIQDKMQKEPPIQNEKIAHVHEEQPQ